MPEVEKLVAGDKARPIVVYCASGSRSAKAKAALEAAGYSTVVNGGGHDDLAAGDPP
jgi:phage shock protein E